MRIRALNYLRDLLTATESADPRAPVELDEGQILAVLEIGRFLPLAPATLVQLPPEQAAGAAQDVGLLWAHGGSRGPVGPVAGQNSGLGDAYQAEAASSLLTKLQLVGLRVRPTVDAVLRLYYDTVDVFTGPGDLGNLEDGRVSTVAGEDWGFIDWTASTPTPDTTNIPNHSARQRVFLVQPLLANAVYEWTIDRAPLLTRILAAQSQAMGWGVWAAAVNTAITVDYAAIVRKLP